MNENPELFNLVQTYQVQSHSNSYRKYKHETCRYRFGKFFTDHTFVSFRLPDDLPEQLENYIPNKRQHDLSTEKQYIDTNLDPRKRKILNSPKDDSRNCRQWEIFLQNLSITEKEYHNALAISIETDF